MLSSGPINTVNTTNMMVLLLHNNLYIFHLLMVIVIRTRFIFHIIIQVLTTFWQSTDFERLAICSKHKMVTWGTETTCSYWLIVPQDCYKTHLIYCRVHSRLNIANNLHRLFLFRCHLLHKILVLFLSSFHLVLSHIIDLNLLLFKLVFDRFLFDDFRLGSLVRFFWSFRWVKAHLLHLCLGFFHLGLSFLNWGIFWLKNCAFDATAV